MAPVSDSDTPATRVIAPRANLDLPFILANHLDLWRCGIVVLHTGSIALKALGELPSARERNPRHRHGIYIRRRSQQKKAPSPGLFQVLNF